jgi:hypothetical protein
VLPLISVPVPDSLSSPDESPADEPPDVVTGILTKIKTHVSPLAIMIPFVLLVEFMYDPLPGYTVA